MATYRPLVVVQDVSVLLLTPSTAVTVRFLLSVEEVFTSLGKNGIQYKILHYK